MIRHTSLTMIAVWITMALFTGTDVNSRLLAADVPIRADTAMAAVADKSPVGILYNADRYERQGQPTEALYLYQKLFDQEGIDSRWGQRGALAIARWHLTRPNPADPVIASQILAELPANMNSSSLDRERKLWQMVVDLHGDADEWLNGDSTMISTDVQLALNHWHIPSQVAPNLDQALSLLAARYREPTVTKKGADYFRCLVETTAHPFVQQLALRHLIDLSLAAGDAVLAAQAARAYWLTTTDEPHRLPDAIERITNTMAVLDASENEIEAFRYRQMLGDDKAARPEADFVRPNHSNSLFSKSLLSEKVIETLSTQSSLSQTTEVNQAQLPPSSIERARLLLLNGDLIPATVLLREALETHRPPSSHYTQTLRLIRMALALQDGHMHQIERYESYLFNKSDGDDPLEMIVNGQDPHRTATAKP